MGASKQETTRPQSGKCSIFRQKSHRPTFGHQTTLADIQGDRYVVESLLSTGAVAMRSGLLCLIVIYVASFTFLDAEQRIRWLGIVLQLGGFWITYSGLNARSRLFSEPDLMGVTISAIKLHWSKLKRRLLHRTDGTVDTVLGAISISSQSKVSVSTIISRANDKTLDERVTASEKEVKRLATQIDSQAELIAAQLSGVRAETQNDRLHLTKAIADIKDIQTRTLAKGIPSEKAGVALFTVGLVLSSASQEVLALISFN